jgi:hypothetical protein
VLAAVNHVESARGNTADDGPRHQVVASKAAHYWSTPAISPALAHSAVLGSQICVWHGGGGGSAFVAPVATPGCAAFQVGHVLGRFIPSWGG